jgi:hypothetical protein
MVMIRCRYADCCKYYHSTEGSPACHDDRSAATSCAAAWQFDQYTKGNKDIGSNVANIFIIREYNNRMQQEGAAGR